MLSRNVMREFRPFFRMLEEPLITRTPVVWGLHNGRSSFEHPFFGGFRPAVDVTEDGNNYVLEAELPGVKKEDVEVHIGDNGRSVIIEGKVFSRRGKAQPVDASAVESSTSQSTSEDQPTPISIERNFTSQSSFTRTISLPRPVDENNVSAKLADGILVVTIPKVSDPGRVKVNID